MRLGRVILLHVSVISLLAKCSNTQDPQVPGDVGQAMNSHKLHYQYLYRHILLEDKRLTVADADNEISKLFNQNIQEFEPPSKAIKVIESKLNTTLWLEKLEGTYNGKYMDPFIFCPAGSYVRGRSDPEKSLVRFYAVRRILCSREKPLTGDYDVTLGGVSASCIIQHQRNPTGEVICKEDKFMESFEFCPDGDYARKNSFGQKCSKDVCSPNGAVCGTTNPSRPITDDQIQLVCCEAKGEDSPTLPFLQEDGTLNGVAVANFWEKLKIIYMGKHNEQLGTNEAVLKYFTTQYKFSRTLQALKFNEGISGLVNAKPFTTKEEVIAGIAYATEIGELSYYAVDEDLSFASSVATIRIIICPKGTYVRGRTSRYVLCSEDVPNVGSVNTLILAVPGICRGRNHIGLSLFECKVAEESETDRERAEICIRGYYGLNKKQDNVPKCTDGSACSDGKVCGLILSLEDRPNEDEKIVCCKDKV